MTSIPSPALDSFLSSYAATSGSNLLARLLESSTCQPMSYLHLRSDITNSVLFHTCIESRAVAVENFHHNFNACKFSNDNRAVSTFGQVILSSNDIFNYSEYYRPSEETSSTVYLVLHTSSAPSQVSRVAFDIRIMWVMANHYQRLRVIIRMVSAKEISLVDRKSNCIARMSKKIWNCQNWVVPAMTMFRGCPFSLDSSDFNGPRILSIICLVSACQERRWPIPRC